MTAKRTGYPFLVILIAAVILLVTLPANPVLGSPPPAQPQQNSTAYPQPLDTAYPGEATPLPDQGYPNPEQPTSTGSAPSEGQATLSLFPSPTLNLLTPSPTAGRDLFGTENSEMGNSQVTPPASETPQPTPTLTPTLTPSVTPGFMQQFQLNRRLFTLGFLLPLGLLIAAWLGYRLLHTGEFKAN